MARQKTKNKLLVPLQSKVCPNPIMMLIWPVLIWFPYQNKTEKFEIVHD